VLEQLYGIQIMVLLEQLYGDAGRFVKLVDQYYGNAAALIRLIDQKYGNADQLMAMLEQPWNLRELFTALREQVYSISGGQHIVEFDQHYALDLYSRYRRLVDQPYVMLPEEDAVEQRPTVTATTATGLTLEPYHLLIEVDENEYTVSGEIHLKDQAQFISCRHMETEVEVVIGSTTFSMLVEGPHESEPGVGQQTYIVPLISPTAALDAPYADTLSQEINAGQASDIVADLAGSISVSWSMVDWYIPAGTIYANDETPYAVIQKIVEAAGGVVQTAPDGSLICRPEYPDSVNVWSTSTPDQYYTDQDNFYSVDSTPEIRDGYNQFTISNEDTLDDDLTLEEEEIDERTKVIKVFQVPLDETETINLSHSGGSWVTVANDGLTSEIVTEEVEIVGGEGTTTNPVYALSAYDYKEDELGAITYHEDGLLQTATDGNSLVEVTYTTKYRKYIVYDPRIENVQFYTEEVA